MKTKFWNLSIYRIIATIAVLMFHIFYLLVAKDIPYPMLLSKGVQGLTAMSGFLYSQKLIENKKDFYLKNIKKLLIPALIVAVCIAIGNLAVMIINNSWDINYFSMFVGNRPFDGRFITQLDNYYYIIYIIGCYIVTPFIQKDNKTSKIIIVSLCVLEIILAFFFRQALIVTAYMVGYIIGKKYFNKYTDYSKFDWRSIVQWIVVIGVAVGLYILAINLRTIENQTWLVKESISLLNNISSASIGVGSFFLISSGLIFVNKFIKKSYFLSFGDKICYIIYLLNQMYMVGSTSVLNMTNDFAG
ncbi:MAG: hypothetical protein HUJ59_02825, partial [Bacilli bacterium]|nr:hypothetical protein [Bacilli bacterium]